MIQTVHQRPLQQVNLSIILNPSLHMIRTVIAPRNPLVNRKVLRTPLRQANPLMDLLPLQRVNPDTIVILLQPASRSVFRLPLRRVSQRRLLSLIQAVNRRVRAHRSRLASPSGHRHRHLIKVLRLNLSRHQQAPQLASRLQHQQVNPSVHRFRFRKVPSSQRLTPLILASQPVHRNPLPQVNLNVPLHQLPQARPRV